MHKQDSRNNQGEYRRQLYVLRECAYGLSRSRDKKGRIVKRSLTPYVMAIHTSVGGGWPTMQVLVVEVYEEDKDKTYE